MIALAVIAIVVILAWFTGRDNPIPPWIVICLIPALAWFGLILIILAMRDWLRKRRSASKPPEE
jgi:hypothetical protein